MAGNFSTEEFRRRLLDWFAREGKTYPWRETTDPWHIIVSEIMLQQTTIPTVLGRYDEWMRRFPDPAAMASADEETVLRSWEGLGYYRRVRSLHQIAKAVVERHAGRFPDNASELMALPGIGEYTCGALLSFAFNIAAPIVDTNVSRVIARLDDYCGNVDSGTGKKYMWARARELVDPVNPRAFNSAIMELGQTLCRSKSVDCLICPARPFCSARDPLALPVKMARSAASEIEHHDIIHFEGGRLLLARQDEGRHRGMYRLPERGIDEVAGMRYLSKQGYSVTRFKVTRHIYHAIDGIVPRKNEFFFTADQIAQLPLASPDRKALALPVVVRLMGLGGVC